MSTFCRTFRRIKVWIKRYKTLVSYFVYGFIMVGFIAFMVIKDHLWEQKYAAMPTYASNTGFHYKLDAETSTAYLFRYDTLSSERVVIPNYFRYEDKKYFVKRIMSGAFKGRKDIVSVRFPKDLYSIEDYAFCGCENIRTILLPKRIEEIGNAAFADCSKLEMINIPSGVRKVRLGTFDGCSNLTKLILADGQWRLEFDSNSELWELPIRTLYLGRGCYEDNGKGPDNYDIFAKIETLETLILGKISFDIDAAMFLKDEGFCGCKNLRHIYCRSEKPYTLNTNAFRDYHYENVVLHVPLGTLEDYKDDWCWKSFKNIVEYDADTISRVLAR